MDLRHLGEFDRIYTYARVSSVEQAHTRQTIEVQENRLKAIVPPPNKHFRDIQTGDDADRPGYLAVIEQVERDAIAGLRVLVVITEQSRLSREGMNKVTDLIEMFNNLYARLYALDGGMLTIREPHEWLRHSQQALFDQYFLIQHRARLQAVKAQRRIEKRPINPRPPYGYAYSREKYLPDLEEWENARNDALMYLPPPYGKGLSLRDCVVECNRRGRKISPHGFRQWLKNPVLRGHLKYSKGGHTRRETKAGIRPGTKEQEIVYNTHEPLITESEWRMIQDRLHDNRIHARRGADSVRYPLSGLVICSECGSRMNRQTIHDKKYGGKYGNYFCRYKKFQCTNHRSVSERKLEAMLLDKVAERAEAIAQSVDLDPNNKPDPKLLELEKQLSDLRQMYDRTKLDELKAVIRAVQEKISALTEQSPISSPSQDYLLRIATALQDKEAFKQLSLHEKRHLYHEICSQILVSPDAVSIVLHL